MTRHPSRCVWSNRGLKIGSGNPVRYLSSYAIYGMGRMLYNAVSQFREGHFFFSLEGVFVQWAARSVLYFLHLEVIRTSTLAFFSTQAAPRGVMQSEGLPPGDEEDAGPPLEKGGFFCFSGELSTEKAAKVSQLLWEIRPGSAVCLC